MDLRDALAHLYALPPDEFIAARSALVAAARAEKDRDLARTLAGVRKPSMCAWVVNQWARASPADLGRLTELGRRLRQAQSAMSGSSLRELGRERGTLLDELTGAALRVATEAGAIPSSAVEREVRETFTAALSAAEAAAAVTSGRLTRSLSYIGLGEVDLTASTAAPLGVRAPETAQEEPPAQPAQGAVPDRVREAAEAAQRASELEDARAARLAEVTAQHLAAQQRVSQLEAELEQAHAGLMELATERSQAARAHRDAQQAAQDARTERDGRAQP